MHENRLIFGDNLEVLTKHIETESIDLVYLDPPFNSKADYNVLFREEDGTKPVSQVKAFVDSWEWNEESARTYLDFVESPIVPEQPKRALIGLHDLLGGRDRSGNGMIAYLSMMAPRLVELCRALKPTGSIYLHCDPTASHYLKLLMDAIFGAKNYRNEIIWRRTGAHSPRRSFGPIHDTILFYSKSADYFFNTVLRPYMKGHVDRRYTEEADGRLRFTSGGNVLTGAGATKGESGRPWRGFDPSVKGRHWAVPGFLSEQMPPDFPGLGVLEKLEALYEAGLIEIKPGTAWPTPMRYLTGGQPLQDIWAYQPYTEGTVYGTDEGIDADVAWLGPTDPERWGYQTQKPLGLLDRILRSSCPEDGVVLDPFCGCGTTIEAAQRLRRRWIGIDITYLAVDLIKRRLRETCGKEVEGTYRVEGEPADLKGAEALALKENQRYQFQYWALSRLGGVPTPKGADLGVDGLLRFHDDVETTKSKTIIFSVKSGQTGPTHVRDLRGVVEREKAAIGVFITLREPTAAMKKEALAAGFYDSPWKTRHARLQIITIREIFDNKRIDMPPSGDDRTIDRPRRRRATGKDRPDYSRFRFAEDPPAPADVVGED